MQRYSRAVGSRNSETMVNGCLCLAFIQNNAGSNVFNCWTRFTLPIVLVLLSPSNQHEHLKPVGMIKDVVCVPHLPRMQNSSRVYALMCGTNDDHGKHLFHSSGCTPNDKESKNID